MPGKQLTQQQIRLFMKERVSGQNQATAAAKAGISERSGRRIDKGELTVFPKAKRHWRTRTDPLDGVWESLLVPLLKANPSLLPITLYEYLCDHHPDRVDATMKRTLQRRVKHWKATQGPEKEVMFRQSKQPGRLGLSDFTELKGIVITISGEPLTHRFYHYRLAYSGWSHVKVILGGESFTALSSGLQDALWRCGGSPQEHRTDSLSAAYNNVAEHEQLTQRYDALCRHYGITATRNNPGNSHENGAIESSHGHFKRRLGQALLLRGSDDFTSLDDYQAFVDTVVAKHNRHCAARFKEEQSTLIPLPKRRTQDYAEHRLVVTSSSTLTLKRVTYSVPSPLIGEKVCVQLYDDLLVILCGHQEVYRCPRVYAHHNQRRRAINYRHVIHSLVRKPQAFRYSQLRNDLLPNADYELIWAAVDRQLAASDACRYIVKLLHFADQSGREEALGRYVVRQLQEGCLASESDYRAQFSTPVFAHPVIASQQHTLASYDTLITTSAEAAYA